MRVRAVAIVLLAVVAPAFGTWLCLQGGNVEIPIDPAEGDADAQANSMEKRTAAASSSAVGGAVRTDASTQGGGEASIEPDAKPFVLRGTFVVVDERGGEYATEDGSFELCRRSGSHSSGYRWDSLATVVLRAGSWEVCVARLPGWIGVYGAQIGGRPAFCELDDQLESHSHEGVAIAAANPPLVLRGRWLAPVTLRVLADDTGNDLKNVRIVEQRFGVGNGKEHPGDDDTVVVEAGSSPIRLSPSDLHERKPTLFVRAPGYAWGSIEVDRTEATERRMRLLPGGDVEMTITGDLPPEGCDIRLRRAGNADPVAELSLEGHGPMPIDGLRAGNYVISVEKGPWHQLLVLGETTVQVRAGMIATAMITLSGIPKSVRASGTLVVPPGWRGVRGLWIHATGTNRRWCSSSSLQFLEGMTRLPTGEYRWDAGKLIPGPWHVIVDGCDYHTGFELGPQGDENVRIVVPDACEVHVRLLDEATGKAIELESRCAPGWHSLADWDGGFSLADMARQPDGSFFCQAPPGKIKISVHAEGHAWLEGAYDVVPGANEFRLSLPRPCGVEVVLKHLGAAIAWDAVQTALIGANGESALSYWCGNRTAAKAPGQFTLTVDPPFDYEPVPPQRVTVKAGEWTKVEIELRRKP